MRKMIVYTSLDNFIPLNEKYVIRSYTELPDENRYWIEENTIKLYKSRNKYELKAEKELSESYHDLVGQVYFRIKGKSYFLDFFIPSLNIAVEIDGKSHNDRKDIDLERDKLFELIGIRTIRIKNEKAKSKNIALLLERRIECLPKKKNKPKKKRTSSRQRKIKAAYKEVMKYKNKVGMKELKELGKKINKK